MTIFLATGNGVVRYQYMNPLTRDFVYNPCDPTVVNAVDVSPDFGFTGAGGNVEEQSVVAGNVFPNPLPLRKLGPASKNFRSRRPCSVKTDPFAPSRSGK